MCLEEIVTSTFIAPFHPARAGELHARARVAVINLSASL
jgi:hypothetical protein